MGYISRPQPLPADTVIVPAVIPDWLSWFRWHAQLAGTGAILGPSRGVPEVGPRVVEMLPLAPSFEAGSRVPLGPPGPASVSPPPPDPGIRRRH